MLLPEGTSLSNILGPRALEMQIELDVWQDEDKAAMCEPFDHV
jgi:hypothetical protein